MLNKRPNRSGSIYRRSSDNKLVVAIMQDRKRIIRYARSEEHARDILRELLGGPEAIQPGPRWCWACEAIGELVPATLKSGHVWMCRRHHLKLAKSLHSILQLD